MHLAEVIWRFSFVTKSILQRQNGIYMYIYICIFLLVFRAQLMLVSKMNKNDWRKEVSRNVSGLRSAEQVILISL